jgi:DNA-binding MarR family transcriptional regulator
VDGVDDLAAIDALQVDAGDAQVGMPKLTLDDCERNAFVRDFDRVGVPELVGCEPPSDTRCAGGVVQLLARRRRLPAASSGRSVDHAQDRADWELATDLQPRIELLPRPPVHPNLPALAALRELSVTLSTATLSVMSDRLTTATGRLPKPDANFGYLFRLAHQRFRRLLEVQLEDLGLSAQEYGILSVFEGRRGLSVSELARVSQVTRQTMHAAILSLEAAGLVERSARNQRVVLVHPTKRGHKRLEAATRRVRAAERAALSNLSGEEERIVRAWLANLASMTTTPLGGNARREEKS